MTDEEPGATEAAAATRATLNRKKRSRVGHRASATRLINQATPLMEAAEHCNKERVEITHERVLIECPGIQHAVHMCCLVYVLSLHACSLLVSQNSTVSTLC